MVGIFRSILYKHALYIMVQTNIKMCYNSESKNDRNYIFGGPCRPFLGLSKARCPHIDIFPWKQSAWFEFPVPHYLRCIMVRPNIKMGHNSGSKKDKKYIFGGPCRPFVGLSMTCSPHFEISPGKKSAPLEFSVPCYLHTLRNGANEYQTG